MFYATLVLVKNSAEQFLLLKRSPNSASYPELWGMPGGKAEDEEAPKETGVRELAEETGIVVSESELILLSKRSLSGQDYYTYLAHHSLMPEVTLNYEHTHFKWVSLWELESQCDFEIPPETISKLRGANSYELRFERGTRRD